MLLEIFSLDYAGEVSTKKKYQKAFIFKIMKIIFQTGYKLLSKFLKKSSLFPTRYPNKDNLSNSGVKS